MTTIRKTLIDIFESQAFDQLEPFKQSTVWKSFAQEERLLLARLLVMQGAYQLAQSNHQALESFEMANQVSSHALEILYQQSAVLSAYRENIRCLMLACQTLARALQQDPLFGKGWYLRAQVLTDMGLFEGEATYFIEAHQNFEKTHTLLENVQEAIDRQEFFWKWGFCLASLGKISGEPIDFYRSIEKYRQAYELGYQEAKFFNDFGHSLVDLGLLLEKAEYFAEALILFNRAVRQEPQAFEGWYNQACCIQSLAEFKSFDKLLEQADRSFSKAVEINPSCGQLWLKWGQLEMTIGKLKLDQSKIEASLLKFARAYQLESGHPQILSSWAESELFLGAQEEKLELLQSARLKLLNSLEIQPDDPDAWYLYGSCLNELGHYFSDEDYYNQAVEKFQYGLSLARHHPLLWYGLALAHFALGELTEQQALFEKAVRYCSRVIECGGEGFPQFWNDWGVALLKLAEMTQQASYAEMAIEKFERALKQPSQNQNEEGEELDLEWVYHYGCALDLLGDLKEESHYFEKAIPIFTQILQLDPHYHLARYNLALALSHLGDAMFDVEPYHKAIEHFQFLLDQDPEDEMVHLDFGMSLTNLGLLVHDIHHPERSQALYRQAESHLMQSAALGNTQAYYQLAGLYSITGHYEHAMHYLERAQFSETLPGIEDLLHDEWLEDLRQIPSFRQFINELSSRQSRDDK
jgi:tetratricopeptide (TPR) repeat protein